MKKTLPAFIAATLITIIIGTGMFLVSQNALGTSTASAASDSALPTDAVVQVEQALVEYQAREAQYQSQLDQAIEQITIANQRIETANQQLDTANQQIQQYENLMAQLQSSGLITIDSTGAVTINQVTSSQQGDRPHRGNH